MRKPPPPRRAPPTHARDPQPAFRKPAGDLVALWGYHAVREALAARRRPLLDLHATEAALPRIADLAREAGLEPRVVAAEALDRRLGREAVHQGLLLEARPLPPLDVADLAQASDGVVLALDQITDPHNVGAILRTAAAFGAAGVVMTERHSPALDGVLAKAASGALDLVPIAQVVNLARALDQLGDEGFQRIGLDSDGAEDLARLAPQGRVALVLGAEGHGLRRLTRERCDQVARLDMPGPIKSLNVSNACAVAFAYLRASRG